MHIHMLNPLELHILNKNAVAQIDIKNHSSKNKGNDFLKKVLYKGEDTNKNSKSLSNSDMTIINEDFNNPSFMKLMKTFSQDQKIFRELNNMPEIQKLKESNPIFKEAFNNPDLMNKLDVTIIVLFLVIFLRK